MYIYLRSDIFGLFDFVGLVLTICFFSCIISQSEPISCDHRPYIYICARYFVVIIY